MFNNFFSENRVVYEIMWGEKGGRAREVTEDNTAHAFCMLDN